MEILNNKVRFNHLLKSKIADSENNNLDLVNLLRLNVVGYRPLKDLNYTPHSGQAAMNSGAAWMPATVKHNSNKLLKS
jgi:hypothetical protein